MNFVDIAVIVVAGATALPAAKERIKTIKKTAPLYLVAKGRFFALFQAYMGVNLYFYRLYRAYFPLNLPYSLFWGWLLK